MHRVQSTTPNHSKSMILLHLIILMDTSLLRFVYVWESASQLISSDARPKYQVRNVPIQFTLCFDWSTDEADEFRMSKFKPLKYISATRFKH